MIWLFVLVAVFAIAAIWWKHFITGLLAEIECERTELESEVARCGLWSRHEAK